jgi:hypothetical protein
MTPRVGILSRYNDGLLAGWPGFEPRHCKIFSLLHGVQTCSEANPASYLMDIGGSFPGGNATEAWSWPLTSIKYRGQEWWSCTSAPPRLQGTSLPVYHYDISGCSQPCECCEWEYAVTVDYGRLKLCNFVDRYLSTKPHGATSNDCFLLSQFSPSIITFRLIFLPSVFLRWDISIFYSLVFG